MLRPVELARDPKAGDVKDKLNVRTFLEGGGQLGSGVGVIQIPHLMGSAQLVIRLPH